MVSRKTLVIVFAALMVGAAMLYSFAPAQVKGERLVLYDNFGYYSADVVVDGNEANFELPPGIDSSSINLRIANGFVISQYIKAANRTSQSTLLSSYVGKEVTVFDSNGKEVTGTLLKYDGKAYVKAGNDLYIITPTYYQLPGFDGEMKDENASIMFRISATNSDAKLSYFLNSISWGPRYTLYLTGNSGTLSLYSAIENNVKEYQNVSLSLVFGDVNKYRSYNYYDYDYLYANKAMDSLSGSVAEAAPSYTPTSTSEYYRFDLGKVDLVQGHSEFNLFEKNVNTVKKTYEMQVSSYGDGTDYNPLSVILTINNSAANGLGVAIPRGVVTVIDDNNFVGENSISDTPVEEEFEIGIGGAFDVIGASKLVDSTSSECVYCTYSSISAENKQLCAGDKDQVTVSTSNIQTVVKNKKNESVNVVLHYNPYYSEWIITDENMQSTKISQNHVQWTFTIPANSEKVLDFTVKYKSSSYCY
ncbi:hypothetical protein KJ780_03395 [Candidatus Micrarchaeota archaeon]|nr:hypothetical protein [Candidatus Micrarchaeota archaeon]